MHMPVRIILPLINFSLCTLLVALPVRRGRTLPRELALPCAVHLADLLEESFGLVDQPCSRNNVESAEREDGGLLGMA